MDTMQHAQLHLSQGNIETTYQLLVTEKGRAALQPFHDRLKTIDDFDDFLADNQNDVQEHDHIDPQTGKIIPAYVSIFLNDDGSKADQHIIFMQHGQHQDPHNAQGENLRMGQNYNFIPVASSMVMNSNGRLEVTYHTIGDEVPAAPADAKGNFLIDPITDEQYPYDAIYNNKGEIVKASYEDPHGEAVKILRAYNKILRQFRAEGLDLSLASPTTAWDKTVLLKQEIS